MIRGAIDIGADRSGDYCDGLSGVSGARVRRVDVCESFQARWRGGSGSEAPERAWSSNVDQVDAT
jgi:hypothetical protein